MHTYIQTVTYVRETRKLPDAALYLVITKKVRQVGESSRPIAC